MATNPNRELFQSAADHFGDETVDRGLDELQADEREEDELIQWLENRG